jgi:NADH:ubiquinone reductase (H+-translocating)
MRSRLLEVLESADRVYADPAESLRFVVIGGGATGVEIAGALGDLLQHAPGYAFKHVDLSRASVTLVDQSGTILGPFGKHSQE